MMYIHTTTTIGDSYAKHLPGCHSCYTLRLAMRAHRVVARRVLRLSTFRLLQVRLVYYDFYNFAFYNFAWNVIVRHLVYLTSVFHNVSIFAQLFWISFLVLSVDGFPANVMRDSSKGRTSRRFSLRSRHSVRSQRCSSFLSLRHRFLGGGLFFRTRFGQQQPKFYSNKTIL